MTTLFYLLVVVLQFADLVTTRIALGLPNTKESNPFLRRMMEKHGIVNTLLAVKSVGVVAAATLWFHGAWGMLLIIAAIYLYVVFQNLRLIYDRT